MTICYIGLGSNLNTPIKQIRRAINRIRRIPRFNIIKISNFYITKAVGHSHTTKIYPNYCNAVLMANTTIAPERLLDIFQQLEKSQGRVRTVPNAPRIIDIDILIYGNLVINTPKLIIPHPRIYLREFVLKPLRSIGFLDNQQL